MFKFLKKHNDGLVDHAKRELKKAGFNIDRSFKGNIDSDYDNAIAIDTLKLIKTVAKQGHSGYSLQTMMEMFNKLVKHEALTEITSDPSEWENVSNESCEDLWQNVRDSKYFSNDGGKTWWSIKSTF